MEKENNTEIRTVKIKLSVDWLLCHDINFLNIRVFLRKHEEEILQKPFQKDRHSKVAHRSLHYSELDR